MKRVLFSLFMSQNVWLSACLRFPSHRFLDFVWQPQSAWEDWENQIRTKYYRGMLFSGNKKRPELEKQRQTKAGKGEDLFLLFFWEKKNWTSHLERFCGIFASRAVILWPFVSDSQTGAILPPKGHLAMSGDIFGCHIFREGWSTGICLSDGGQGWF